MDDLIKKEMAGTPTVQQAEKLYNIRNVENFTHNEIHMPDVAFQSHAADWALLNTEFYNLFVLQNENFKDGSFSLSTDVALKNTERELKNKFKTLSSDLLLHMPCVFAVRNPSYKTAPGYHMAYLGKLTGVTPQGDNIKFCFDIFEKFKQQLINENIRLFNLQETTLRNQLDEVHWSIRTGNLLEIIDNLGIEIK